MFQSGQQVKSKDWNPELGAGRHHRARLGFILMSTDLAAEADFFDMAPEGVAVHITRLKTDDYTTNETLSATSITWPMPPRASSRTPNQT
jgi:maleate isomerase